ncbi:MAG: response regulator [Terriglobales bacterium]
MGHPSREILCIDDDEQTLRVRTIVLETLGYHVWAESDARNALSAFEDHDISAVVMDYQMPGMNGGEAAREMKRLRPDVPVMILSALPWLPESAPADAIDMFVQKGEPLKVLANRIEEMIAAHERQLELPAHVTADNVGSAIGGFLGNLAATLRPRKKITIH